MNDFSKKELQIIHLDMMTYIHRTTILKESPIHKRLRDKIESMIDNYCEHSEDMSLQYIGDEWCVKCKRKIE